MKEYYSKWVRGIDRGKPETDTKTLKKGLAALRGK